MLERFWYSRLLPATLVTQNLLSPLVLVAMATGFSLSVNKRLEIMFFGEGIAFVECILETFFVVVILSYGF